MVKRVKVKETILAGEARASVELLYVPIVRLIKGSVVFIACADSNYLSENNWGR